MEDMRPIFMYMDAFLLLTIYISTQVWTLIYY